MIFLNLTGRLGNQLLLYSKALEEAKPNEKIFINVFEYNSAKSTSDGRKIRLDIEEIVAPHSLKDIVFFNSKLFYLLAKYFSELCSRISVRLGRDKFYSYDYVVNLLFLKIIVGYHQTRQTYTNLKNISINSLTLPKKTCKNWIAVHVRMGDYLTSQHANHNIGVETALVNYFKRNIDESQKRHLVIFSDGQPDLLINFLNNFGISYDLANAFAQTDIDQFLYMCSFQTVIASNSSFSCCAAHMGIQTTELYVPEKWLVNFPTPKTMFPDQVKYYEV